MFGIGSILGKVAGGLLDKIGLGKIAPFVKMGLNALTGNWLGVAQDVFSLVSGFKGNSLNSASKNPPLGGFENSRNNFSSQNNPLSGNRVSGLLKGLSQLFKGLSGGNLGGIGKIFNAFKTLMDSFSNNQLYNNRLSTSQFSNIQG